MVSRVARVRNSLSRAFVCFVCIFTAGCRSPRPPEASQWVVIGSSADVAVSLDTERVRVDSVGARVWLRFDYARPQRVSDSTRQFTRSEIEEYLDCQKERVRDIEMQVFDSTVRVGRRISDSSSWVPFRRHPASDVYFKLACEELRRSGKLTSTYANAGLYGSPPVGPRLTAPAPIPGSWMHCAAPTPV